MPQISCMLMALADPRYVSLLGACGSCQPLLLATAFMFGRRMVQACHEKCIDKRCVCSGAGSCMSPRLQSLQHIRCQQMLGTIAC